MDKITIWEQALKILAKDLSPTLLKIWFTKVEVFSIIKESGSYRVVFGCPNQFLTEQIEKRCGGMLISALEQVLGEKVALELKVIAQAKVVDGDGRETQNSNLESNGKPGQDLVRTFDNFVVGESNRLAYSAAKAACDNPGTVYNPLFIYGGTGLGKTHLLKACANQLTQDFPNLKIAYKTTEAFTNEFIDGLATGAVRLFRERHRGLGVLLIDDVQFLSGKPSTQDEFFHTFNELYSAHHQVILTSDRHPSEIGRLEERLVSRFLGGLTVDIAPPELELKMAILSKKAGILGLDLDSQIIEFLAQNVANPREIEGVVVAVAQSIKLGGAKDLTTIKALFGKKQPQIRAAPKQIISAVAKFYGLKFSDIAGNIRKKEVVKARQIVMFLLRFELGLSYEFIGQILGGKDHSTIIHGVGVVKKEVDKVSVLREDLLEIKNGLAF